MPICLNRHARYQIGCPDCEAVNFRSGPADPTRGPARFCVDAKRLPTLRYLFRCSWRPDSLDSAHRVGHDTRNAEQARNTKTRGAAKWMLLTVVIGAALVARYFLLESESTEPLRATSLEEPSVSTTTSSTITPISLTRESSEWLISLTEKIHRQINVE